MTKGMVREGIKSGDGQMNGIAIETGRRRPMKGGRKEKCRGAGAKRPLWSARPSSGERAVHEAACG